MPARIIFALLISGFGALISAQEANDLVTRLQEEITGIESRLHQTVEGQQNIADKMEDIDREIELRRRLINELSKRSLHHEKNETQIRNGINALSNDLNRLAGELREQEKSLTELRLESGQRMNYMYRRIRANRLNLLLGSNNLNDLSQRQHYLRAVEKHDKNQILKLKDQIDIVALKRDKVNATRNRLSADRTKQLNEIKTINSLIALRANEEIQLADEKLAKYQMLEKAKEDAELFNALLNERRNSLLNIENEIVRLETVRPAVAESFHPTAPFKSLRGRLPSPIRHRKVLHKFGNVQHPVHGTTTVNPGVDFAAELGEEVFAVATGQATRVAWLRGFGNTVILSHGDGYYTVYARLGSIQVSEGEVVPGGKQIGTVGDTGIETGFHFEVWEQRTKMNPITWLGK